MISIVVTIYNEERIVPELLIRLERVFEVMRKNYEIIFVDDGSTDATAAYIEKARKRNERVKLIQFSRNFGQVAALRAGLLHAQGDVIVTMDGDLQDLPEEIPLLIEKLDEGHDIAYAKREERKHSFFRNISSRVFACILAYAMARGGVVPSDKEALVFGVFRAMRREVVDAFNILSEQSGYFQGLVNWVGFRHTVVPVTHGARTAGRSHYSLRKLLRYGLEAIVFLMPFPLRFLIFMGAGIAIIAFVSAFLTRYVLFFVISFWGGVNLAVIGIMGEYIGRVLLEAKRRPLFVIRKKLL